MIVFPDNWQQDYSEFIGIDPILYAINLLDMMRITIEEIKVPHLAYSGGIDSTIVLCLLTEFFGQNKVHTYTISSRKGHPDIEYAKSGSKLYRSIHHEFIVTPSFSKEDKFDGDNAVRQLFENVKKYTDKIICCDGLDEFMCGYYDHLEGSIEIYKYYLSRLFSDHLDPLNKLSKNIKVFLPYLDPYMINIMTNIELYYKVDNNNRKKIVTLMAKELNIPDYIINRNKYGFCDAFMDKDK